MNQDQVWQAVDDHRVRLIRLLEGVSDEEWRRPSLCEGWTVRDVAGHLAWQQRVVTPATVVGMLRARGDLARAIHDIACRHARRPTGALIAQLSLTVGKHTPLPGTTYLETLLDILIHGQDIAVPLGRRLEMSRDAAAVAATRVWSEQSLFPATKALGAYRFSATDIDWSVGEGREVNRPIGAILLLLTGRPAGLPDLTGEGVAAIRAGRSGG